jgi:hypothetical protein
MEVIFLVNNLESVLECDSSCVRDIIAYFCSVLELIGDAILERRV